MSRSDLNVRVTLTPAPPSTLVGPSFYFCSSRSCFGIPYGCEFRMLSWKFSVFSSFIKFFLFHQFYRFWRVCSCVSEFSSRSPYSTRSLWNQLSIKDGSTSFHFILLSSLQILGYRNDHHYIYGYFSLFEIFPDTDFLFLYRLGVLSVFLGEGCLYFWCDREEFTKVVSMGCTFSFINMSETVESHSYRLRILNKNF